MCAFYEGFVPPIASRQRSEAPPTPPFLKDLNLRVVVRAQ